MALLHVVFAEGLDALGAADGRVEGLDEVRALAADFPPEAVAEATGLDADDDPPHRPRLRGRPERGRLRPDRDHDAGLRHDDELADRHPQHRHRQPRPPRRRDVPAAVGRAAEHQGRARPRPRRDLRPLERRACAACGEVFGELPVACLAEEIQTPGEGQVRALITVAGNPLLSTPNSDRLAAAMDELDFMVSVDIYLNETTRHADVILPSPSPLEKAHFDFIFQGFSVRNYANWSPPVLEPPGGHAGRVGDRAAARRDRHRPGTGRRRRRRSTSSSRGRRSAERSPTRSRPGTAATSRRRWPSWHRGPAASGWST